MPTIQELGVDPTQNANIELPTLASVKSAVAKLPTNVYLAPPKDLGPQKQYAPETQTPEALLTRGAAIAKTDDTQKMDQLKQIFLHQGLAAMIDSLKNILGTSNDQKMQNLSDTVQKNNLQDIDEPGVFSQKATAKGQGLVNKVTDQVKDYANEHPEQKINPIDTIKQIYGNPESPKSGATKVALDENGEPMTDKTGKTLVKITALDDEQLMHNLYAQIMAKPEVKKLDKLDTVDKLANVLSIFTPNPQDTEPMQALKREIHNDLLDHASSFVPEAKENVSSAKDLFAAAAVANEVAQKNLAASQQTEPPARPQAPQASGPLQDKSQQNLQDLTSTPVSELSSTTQQQPTMQDYVNFLRQQQQNEKQSKGTTLKKLKRR